MKAVISVLLGVSLSAMAEEPRANVPDSTTPIDLTIVGYDVGNDTNAQKQFQAMAAAVKASGGKGQVLTAGLKEGELESAMTAALGDVAAPPPPAEPSMRLERSVVAPGQKIRVFIGNPPTEKLAWIGFYKLDAGDKDYIKYSYLNVLDNNTYEDILAPDETGKYNFRLFKDESYQPVMVSAPLEVR
jgi:hypothetical protein